ncbi:A disintegrin and metalloproteinase with thrombospondin motifs 7-like [Dermacentor andersoni]|uniref:A disintegrin and metalloproteinase with thrombospondin motifs 7-like n=1 Tax=Dermacentor andersoni TaxID=34620 RepID=UPI00241806EF|nr:A disintegrin and metalloproteinase with thrombospondin motifs adt-1-like [Dermacentor andersoni]
MASPHKPVLTSHMVAHAVRMLFLIALCWECVSPSLQPSIHKELNQKELVDLFSVHSHAEVPEYQVVKVRLKRYLEPSPTRTSQYRTRRQEPGKLLYYAHILGRNLEMNLKKNQALIARNLRVVRKTRGGREIPLSLRRANCHYLGVNGSVVAAFSECDYDGGISGVILLPEEALQVKPVPSRLRHLVPDVGHRESEPPRQALVETEDVPHVLYTAPPPQHKSSRVVDNRVYTEKTVHPWQNHDRFPWSSSPKTPGASRPTVRIRQPSLRPTGWPQRYPHPDRRKQGSNNTRRRTASSGTRKNGSNVASSSRTRPVRPHDERQGSNAAGTRTERRAKFLELALFVDQKAYLSFLHFLGSEQRLMDFVLGYLNQVQAIYVQPSLREKIYISLVHLELQETQPADLPHYNGNRDLLLSSFCKYQAHRNLAEDSRWDAALYLSGLNFFSIEEGRRNVVTMGLAPVGGVCHRDHSCVITEIGTTSDAGKPYASAGWTSAYVAAHEIGHNLGMLHDGWPHNDCPSNGFIMSPSRGTKGETTWSACSALVVLKMGDRTCLSNRPDGVTGLPDLEDPQSLPGQEWDAHDQCKIFLRDHDALLYNTSLISNVCEQVICRTHNRQGYYKAGPALDGTFCGDHNWCLHGQCMPARAGSLKTVAGGWGPWRRDSCHSGCLDNAKGFSRDRRRCDRPKPRNTANTCRGDSVRTRLCDDSKICQHRENPVVYASRKCAEWKTLVRDLSSKGAQVRHNPTRPWQACAVYCKITNGPWYTPRTELNDLSGSFFPDGTWCHSDGRQDYYCQNHVCQAEPPKASSSKGRALWLLQDVDVEPRLQNARPLSSLRAPAAPVYDAAFIYEEDSSRPVGVVQTTSAGAGSDDAEDQEYADKDYVTLPDKPR